MADAPVVVMKFRPVKPGNSVEDKTGTMMSGGLVNRVLPKAIYGAKGQSKHKVLSGGEPGSCSVHKWLDRVGSSGRVAWEQVGSTTKSHEGVILLSSTDCLCASTLKARSETHRCHERGEPHQ